MFMHGLARWRGAAVAGAFAAALASPALADPIIKNLGGGWQVTILQPAVSDISTVSVSLPNNELVISKEADFNLIDPDTGQPATISVVFEQIAPDEETVSRIKITEEIVRNNTPVDWDSFRILLFPNAKVEFDVDASAGFSIDPFTTRSYLALNSEVVFAGGVVTAGSTWNPGADSGELVIDIDLSNGAPVAFTMKEQPIPEPASILGMLALAAALRRRGA
ncbi:MAG TPA: PEP-CTERM sorting domain-containing protein [Phycisphaerae bacterium]|nr:PEP-CTERM sorting domain-containing protein [Phycisphaerae bacterium]